MERERDFRIAILEAYKQVGDEKALPIVERLANTASSTPAQRLIQEAAQECLPYMKIRVDKLTAPMSLLRGASAGAAPAESLLRAASLAGTSTSAELLRPNEAR